MKDKKSMLLQIGFAPYCCLRSLAHNSCIQSTLLYPTQTKYSFEFQLLMIYLFFILHKPNIHLNSNFWWSISSLQTKYLFEFQRWWSINNFVFFLTRKTERIFNKPLKQWFYRICLQDIELRHFLGGCWTPIFVNL